MQRCLTSSSCSARPAGGPSATKTLARCQLQLPRRPRKPGLQQRGPAPQHSQRHCATRALEQEAGAALAHGTGTALLQALQWGLTSVAAYVAAAWPERPRGWCRKDLLEVRESGVAGLGVFARAAIPAGTVLGAYPGRPRAAQEMQAKIARAPGAACYCFQTRDGYLLDPTDTAGEPSDRPGPGLAWLPVDPTLCRINEPLPGSSGPNVEVQDDPRDGMGLLFVAAREVVAGEELLLDYGPVYDRTRYGRQ